MTPAARPAVAGHAGDAEGAKTPIGGLPRASAGIAPLAYEDLDEPLKAALAPKVARLGYLGAFFAVLGHQPRALGAFHSFTEELKEALDDNLAEVVALTIASALDNEYERVQHERLAMTHGRPEAWIAEASWGQTAEVLSPTERAVRDLALAMLKAGGRGSREQLSVVAAVVGEAKAAAILLLIGRFIAHAHISNALELATPVRAEDPSS